MTNNGTEYNRGYQDGYQAAVNKLMEAAGSYATVLPPAARNKRSPCSSYTLALEYLAGHPEGCTAHEYSKLTNNSSVLYKLANAGRLRKEGPRFFAVDAQNAKLGEPS